MGERRVLMIAHHFPPAGGSGANRALAFARYLPEYGWRPTVVTPGVGWALNRDDALVREIPTGVRVVRTRSWESKPALATTAAPAAKSIRRPSGLRKNLGHLKRTPDAHVGWLPFALAAARREAYDVAYSSSGPFTSHLVGLLLKRMTRKPWVAELRDGWYRWNRAIFADYPAWRDTIERRLEAAALRSADRVVLVTERMAGAFRAQYADVPADHFAVVSNGFDPAQFENPTRRRHLPGWEVVHAGLLYYGRSVTAFLRAAKNLSESDNDFAREFRLTLLGTLDAGAHREIQNSGLGERLRICGQVDHAQAIQLMRAADALLLVANTTPGAEATVPGKLFEYLAVGRPVLAVAPLDSSTADVLRQTGGGWLAPAGDPDAIVGVLRHAFAQRTTPPRPDPVALAQFDRRVLACELARIFDQVLDHARWR
jgi:glycosyltransferase involved in cell wall biosynthesis